MPDKIKLEVCANSVESAINAQHGGAYRVELCDNLYEGGTTPSIASIETTRRNIEIKLNVLIRPRGGDFLYKDFELDIMKYDIIRAKDAGADGIVMGVLNRDAEIDIDKFSRLIEAAGTMSVTFHRAFDMVREPFAALQQLISLGVERVLTSGMKNKASEGVDLISQLVKVADGKISIMPGSGINASNAREIIEKTNVTEIHASCRRMIESSMIFRRDNIHMGGLKDIPEFGNYVTDTRLVKDLIGIINNK